MAELEVRPGVRDAETVGADEHGSGSAGHGHRLRLGQGALGTGSERPAVMATTARAPAATASPTVATNAVAGTHSTTRSTGSPRPAAAAAREG